MDAAALKTFLTRYRMLDAEDLSVLESAGNDAETLDLAVERGLIDSQLVQDAIALLEDGLPKGLEPHLKGLVLLQEIGRGASGRVFRAWQPKLRRIVAVKVMPRASLADEKAKTRFVREARIAARLSHPSLVRALDIGSAGESVYIILEYVEGESLQARLQADGPLSISDTLWIGKGVADGLAYAAANGIAHRDIKPANVQLTSDGVKILDLGLARPEGESELTLPMMAVGTPAYISPEQARGETMITPQADVYALGVLIFRCIAGKHPFKAIDGADMLRAHVERMPPAMTSVSKECPDALSELVEQMMAKSPDDRPTAAQVAGHLRLLLTQIEGSPEKRSTSARRRPTKGISTTLPVHQPSAPASGSTRLIAVAAVCLLLGGALAWFLRPLGEERSNEDIQKIQQLEKSLQELKDARAQDAHWKETLERIRESQVPPDRSDKAIADRVRQGLADNEKRFDE